MYLKLEAKGSFGKTELFLKKMTLMNIQAALVRYAEEGVAALASATPIETGFAAYSWDYEVVKENGGWTINWTNSDIQNGFPVVIMLQYGHGTGTGGYVQGRDFINPAIQPIFDRIAENVWKVVTSA